MARRVQAVIEAKDRASPTLNKLGATVQGLGVIAAAVGGIALGRKLVEGIVAATAASSRYEGATVRLAVALANQGENTREIRDDLLTFARAQQRVSLATETQIIDALAMAKTLGATDEAAKKLVAGATDLASATGVELDQAFRQVNRTLSGLPGELGEIFFELKNLTAEELRAGAAADVLAAGMAGAGTAGADTLAGAINNLNSAFDALQVTVGGPVRDVTRAFLAGVVTPMIDDLNAAALEADSFRDALFNLAIGAAQAGATIADVAAAMGSGEGGITRVLKDAAGFVTEGWGKAIDTLRMAGDVIEFLDGPTSKLGDRLRATAKELERLRDAGPGGAESLDGIKNRAEEALPPLETLVEQLAELSKIEVEPAKIEALPRQETIGPNASILREQFAEMLALQDQAFDELLQAQIDSLDELSEVRLDKQLEMLDREREIELEQSGLTSAAKAAIEEKFQIKRTQLVAQHGKKRAALEELSAKQQIALTATVLSNIVTALGIAFGDSKAIKIAQAIINTLEAVTEALPNIPLAASIAAIGAAQVAKIISTKPGTQKFQEGGFVVPGAGGAGDVVPAMLEPGDLVLTPEQQAAAGGFAGALVVEVEMGPNMRRLADELTVSVRRGSARLVATEIATVRSSR